MEWMIAAGAVLGSLLVTASLVFRRSLAKARRGGRAHVEHVRAEAERIRTAANQRLREAETALPRLRVEAEGARRAGTLHRDAEDLLTRQSAANETARRAAQSFNTALDRHRELLRSLEEAGLLRDTGEGPTIDTGRLRPAARETGASLGRHLQELEWYRVNGQKDGISGPLNTPAFTEEQAASLGGSLDRAGRVDEERIRELTRKAASGHDLLAQAPGNLAEAVRERKGLSQRIDAARVRRTGERAPGRKL